eukprot:7473776-Pyramimonas_sp.AAC.1
MANTSALASGNPSAMCMCRKLGIENLLLALSSFDAVFGSSSNTASTTCGEAPTFFAMAFAKLVL